MVKQAEQGQPLRGDSRLAQETPRAQPDQHRAFELAANQPHHIA